jgi:DNA polymerase III alpha subunit
MHIHLTAHSTYSLHQGLVTPAELVQTAQAHGMPALGLTDHHLLTGAIEFVTACKQNEIQPIIGLEIDLPDGPVNLLGTSMEGWSNLCRLSSAIALRDDGGSLFADLLASYSKDLIALTSQPSTLKEIFRDRLYIALRDPSQAAAVADLARKSELPTVVAHPIYLLNTKQARLQRTLTAIRLNQTIRDLSKDAPAPANSSPSSQEIRQGSRSTKALAATLQIAERCRFDLPIGGCKCLSFHCPRNICKSISAAKATECRQLYGGITPVQERLDHG